MNTLLAVVLGVALVFLLVWLFGNPLRENFFNNNANVVVNWTAPVSANPLTYQWTYCVNCSGGNSPTFWGSPITTTTATSVTLDASNFSGDFGGLSFFAVAATDTVTKLQSTWTTVALQFTPANQETSVSISGSFGSTTSFTPLQATQTEFVAQAVFNGSLDAGTVQVIDLVLQRGATMYEYYADANLGNSGTGSDNTLAVIDSFSSSVWTPSAPGPLVQGDTITAYFLSEGGNKIVAYYSTSVSAGPPPAPVAPSPPSIGAVTINVTAP
jgi:hypothetical protein